MESIKMVLMNLFAGREWGPRCREWTCGHPGGGREWTNGESSTDIYTLSRVKWMAGEGLLYNPGSPVWSSVMT